ncbi:RGR1 [[Candida] subhashii]|uniref:Mediator of RNA polymerase II transcription subunit 14 n=1 Tax=[Candida] subhashii TaxID=561895 RepID=A0A8J5UIC9_9ASCO|nr:RGR1 [[Candida] subhashii]KAG7663528.1 RGR1 [[Candida] subhashii]
MHKMETPNGISDSTNNSNIAKKGQLSPPPEIPHITNNILPLSHVLKYYTQEAYKQLTRLIENLSLTTHSESDVERKKKFLEIIIQLRQDFIKIYTLVKWSANAKDVGKFIDLLNWFRMQEFYFEQLTFQLNALNGFSGAKLPNSDLFTALEVLFKKRPQLPSYNHIKSSPISPQKTLEVLKDLNLALMTRFALMDIPTRFLNNYDIKDGRVYISVPNEFQVSITVGNELIIDDPKDYHKSPFYFIDFKFLFGINPETLLITHRDNKIITRLPPSSHAKLEKVANQILLNQGLEGLYELLHKYSISFKLYLIAKQLKELLINTRWRNNIQINYQNGKSLIIVNYWSSHYLSRNWKSFLELGIDRNYNLNYRWFKNGKYDLQNSFDEIFQSRFANNEEVYHHTNENDYENAIIDDDSMDNDEDSPEDLNVDLILNVVVNKHAELLMDQVYHKLTERFNDAATGGGEQISMINCHQLLLKLSPNKSTIFAINPLTGYFYFIDPSPLQNQITKKINSPPPPGSIINNNKNFTTEADMINYVIDQLIQLRLEVFTKEINNKLFTTEWINNDIITLNDYENNKLSMNSNIGISKIQFYRRKNWPSSSWFLINLVSGITTTTFWWVARIKSIKGEWKIQWVQKIKFDQSLSMGEEEGGDDDDDEQEANGGVSPQYLNYEFFTNLSTLCANMIIDHVILEELQFRNIKFLKVNQIEAVLHKFHIDGIPQDENVDEDEIIKSEDGVPVSARDKPLIYESVIMIYNNNDLLPIYNSSTSLFLKIKLINHHNTSLMKLRLFGTLRNLSLKTSPANFLELNLRINETKQYFQIDDVINLSNTTATTMNDTRGIGVESNNQLLEKLFNNLNKFGKLIKIVDQLSKNNIEIINNNSVNDITIKVDDGKLGHILIKLPESANDSIRLMPGNACAKEVELILQYINGYLKSTSIGTRDKNSKVTPSIVGIIRYLQEIIPIINSISQIKQLVSSKKFRLPNGLPKLNFDVMFNSLDSVQYIFHLSSANPTSSKKIVKDRIVINVSFKQNKFDTIRRNLIKISLKDNLNQRNLKYKKLFELIFKSISDFDLSRNKENDEVLVKLNYDFLVSINIAEEIMNRIGNSFMQYLQLESK